MGFGLNFYGFFLYSIVWVSAYFCWARYRNNKDKLSQ